MWALARSPLLQRELPALGGELQAVAADRLEDFTVEGLTSLVRDLATLQLSNSRCATRRVPIGFMGAGMGTRYRAMGG